MSYLIVFTTLPYAFFVLTLITFVFRVDLSRRARLIFAGVLLLAFSKFPAFALLGGHAFTPELPAVVIWSWDFFYSGAMLLSALALLLVWMRFRAKKYLLPLVAWGLAGWGLYNGACVPSVRQVTLSYKDLPSSLEGYRIVQLSDLHCSSAARRWRTQAVVDAVNALKSDLICLTGDLADGSVDAIAPHLEPLKTLHAHDGVYACTGNHEYYHDYNHWMTRFYAQATNIRVLDNECVFPRPGLALGGITDITAWRAGAGVGKRKWFDTFAEARNGEFRVLLVHRPAQVMAYAEALDFRLQLSGHTHGGIAPLISYLVKLHNGGFVRGLYSLFEDSKERYLYVNPGCGQWAGFPMRFFNDSEITLFTLRRASSPLPSTNYPLPTTSH